MRAANYGFLLLVALCGCTTSENRTRLAGFYSTDAFPHLELFGDNDGHSSKKNAGVVFVLAIDRDGTYTTHEYQLFDGKAVTAAAFGLPMQRADHGAWALKDGRILLTSDQDRHEQCELAMDSGSGGESLMWQGTRYLKRATDIIAPLAPSEKWILDFGREHWKVDTCYYATPSQPVIQYSPHVTGGQAAGSTEQTLTDDYLPNGFEHIDVPLKRLQWQFTYLQLRGGLVIAKQNVVYDRASEALVEYWTEGFTAQSGKQVPGYYNLALVRTDAGLSAKYRLPYGAFYLTYRIPTNQMSEEIRSRWIERLRKAVLK
jgi:hypothetical protein